MIQQIIDQHRCAATHVDPVTGQRDIDLVPALFEHYGRLTCGLYLQVTWGGTVTVGDAAGDRALPTAPAAPPLDDRAPIRAN